MKKIALLASGSGSNVENIIRYFADSPEFSFPLIISNRKDAYVHERAKKLNVPSVTLSKDEIAGDEILELLRRYEIDSIVLAGFLLKVPEHLIKAYTNKIINIHPALLPKYGGTGMYGHHVHDAVVQNKETETGITIHYVNEHYDEGKIIFQATCQVLPTDSPEDVAKKVHELEYTFFPEVIRKTFGPKLGS